MEDLQSDTLSPEAKRRLRWIEHYEKYRNARLTCRHFGISPDTFYLWKKRFDRKNPATLEDNMSNRRPKRLRGVLWSQTIVEKIRKLHKANPGFGKYRITKMLAKNGFSLSEATTGRILTFVKGQQVNKP